jgi:hypothetical protein
MSTLPSLGIRALPPAFEATSLPSLATAYAQPVTEPRRLSMFWVIAAKSNGAVWIGGSAAPALGAAIAAAVAPRANIAVMRFRSTDDLLVVVIPL